MKKTFKLFIAFLAMTLLSVFILQVGAKSTASEIPVESYTYWEDVGAGGRKPVYIHDTHTVNQVIDANSLGIKPFEELNDVCTDDNGNIYLLDGKASRIIVVNENYELEKEITKIESGSEEITFSGAQNIFAHKDGKIYICDTENARVLIIDSKGKLLATLTKPNSTLIPEGYKFNPISIAVDSTGYTYVLCDSSYHGAILYSPEGEFLGFYGANKVKNTITQAFSTMMSRLFVNNAKKSASESVLPYCFVDICVGPKDFVYTTTGFTNINDMKGQIKKLSPGDGSNIIDSDKVNFADDGTNWSILVGDMLRQDISSIDIDEKGFIYSLDTAFGRVYIYDEEGRLLSAFGGGANTGDQDGVFRQAKAIALNGSDVLVVDSAKSSLTVFKETEFGTQFKEARALTLAGNYAESKELWLSVIKQDKNCQLAYNGLARAYLNEEDYDRAIEYSKQGYDRQTYSLAFAKVRTQFISDNFVWILILGCSLIIGLLIFAVVSMKRKVTLVKNDKLSMLFRTLIHPFDAFDTIKEKQMGSIVIGGVLVVIYYIMSVLSDLCGGFTFTYVDLANYNSLWVLVRSVGIVVLWIICNKLVTTLMDGKGKTKDIFVVTTYSLVPIIIGEFTFLILSNVMMADEAEFLIIFRSLMLGYTLILLMIGTIKIHDYSMGKFLGTTLLTLISMAVVVFLIIMIFILSQQFVAFLATLYIEIS